MFGILATVIYLECAPLLAGVMAVGAAVKLMLDSAEVAQRIRKVAREEKKAA